MSQSISSTTYAWNTSGLREAFCLAWVPGKGSEFYRFGHERTKPIRMDGFFMATTPVTQALWTHVMGNNPSLKVASHCPVETVSWHDVCQPNGFLERANELILPALDERVSAFRLRLPSETEWEYAARGGPAWLDNFAFSGSNDPDQVAWYGPRWTWARQTVVQLLGPRLGWQLAGRWPRPRRRTETHEVAQKAPNQLGLYDMSGNVWEWCQDV